MGKTLWQRWTEKAPKPVEYNYYDPLGVKIGGSITIDELDYRDLPFFVKEIREYKRPELGDQYAFTDYVLLARPIGKEDKWVRIRCFNLPDSKDGLPYQPCLMEQYDQLAYDENPQGDYQGLFNAVKDTTGKFDINTPQESVEFYRPVKAGGGYQLSSYKAQVTIITECLKEGVADQAKLQKEEQEYWNYSRTTKDEANQDYEEYVFVELNTDNGWMLVWRGIEMNPHHVILM